MPELLTTQLSFRTNAKYILHLLRSAPPKDGVPPQFSLASIKPMPDALRLPDVEPIRPLLALNIAMPSLSEKVQQRAATQWFAHPPGKADEAAICERIDRLRRRLADASSDGTAPPTAGTHRTALALVEKAAANFNQYGFLSQYDWRMAHWGTIADIQSVTASTFELPTDRIEFTTLWTPPLAAAQALADLFPSVRFELRYRLEADDPWTEVEIFPTRPWGY